MELVESMLETERLGDHWLELADGLDRQTHLTEGLAIHLEVVPDSKFHL